MCNTLDDEISCIFPMTVFVGIWAAEGLLELISQVINKIP